MKILSSLSARKLSRKIGVIALCVALEFGFFSFDFLAYAGATGQLSSVSVQLGDPRPSQSSVTYTSGFTVGSSASIKCINVVFATNADMTGGVPSGLTTTGSTIGTFKKNGSDDSSAWSLYTTSNNGTLQYEDSSGESETASDVFSAIQAVGITNPSVSTFYAQVTTYNTLSTHTCSGVVDQSNVLALVTTQGVSTTVTVQPTLSFSVAGTSGAINGGPASNPITTASSIAFGTVPAGGSATSAAQLLTASTNASHGYSIYIRNNQLLTNANSDTIAAQTCASSDCSTVANNQAFSGSSSTSSFGFTTDSSNDAITSNHYVGLTTSNVQIDHQTSAQNAKTVNVEYQLQLKNTQPPGTYSNVITYTAIPSY